MCFIHHSPLEYQMLYRFLAVAIISAVMASGCRSHPGEVLLPEPRPLGSGIAHVGKRDPDEAAPDVAASVPEGVLTLQAALAAALLKNPQLAAFSWEIRAAEGRMLQAGLRPNPELEGEVEEFGGSAERQGFDSAETTIRLSQLVELGGKRMKRKQLAAAEASLAGWDYETTRLDVLTDVAQAFADLLAAQERQALADESLALAERVLAAVSEQVKAGKVSPVEETKAGVSAAGARIERDRATRGLEAARKRLALAMGEPTPAFERAQGDFDRLQPVPPSERLAELLGQNPDVARWQSELAQRRAALAVEKSRRVPDLTVGGGISRFHAEDDNAFVMSVSIPLPLFDRNQGAVREAAANLAKAEHERHAAELQANLSLADACEALASAHTEATTLKQSVLPAAQSAFDAADEGFRQGKFDYLEVLDAQRTLVESKGQYIAALAEYHKSVAEVERLIGQGLNQATKSEEN